MRLVMGSLSKHGANFITIGQAMQRSNASHVRRQRHCFLTVSSRITLIKATEVDPEIRTRG
jgi:hypothetical protein